VPPHLTRAELHQLNVQDRLRRTNIQVPIVIALVAMFVLLTTQFVVNSRQWASDYQLRADQANALHFSEATKALAEQTQSAHLAGIYSLQYLVEQDARRNQRRVAEMLTAFVRSNSLGPILRLSKECNGDQVDAPAEREEPREDVQAALNVLGNRDFAPNRRVRFDDNRHQCVFDENDRERMKYGSYRMILEHRNLDEVNLANTDFSCAKFSATRFRRASFEWATLMGTDFNAARFGVIDIPGFTEILKNARAESSNQFSLAKWLHEGEPSWRRYRCWTAFFQHATLDNVQFNAASLVGASFRQASLKGGEFWDANISGADFRDAEIIKDQLLQGCIMDGDMPLHDFGSELQIRPCPQWAQDPRP
jgi:uncharacterized protein YjbI with pentapeptide repeats